MVGLIAYVLVRVPGGFRGFVALGSLASFGGSRRLLGRLNLGGFIRRVLRGACRRALVVDRILVLGDRRRLGTSSRGVREVRPDHAGQCEDRQECEDRPLHLLHLLLCREASLRLAA